MADSAAGFDWSQLLGAGASLAGMGLSASAQGQQDQILQNTLKTIGPTQLQGYNLSGPGGMSAGYNPNGGASIGLGSLSPAFSELVNGGTGGAGAYSPGLLSNLTGGASGTLNPALANLSSAYSGNNLFQGLAATQAGNLGQTYGDIYNSTLANMRAQAAPGIQQQAYGLQNTLFGNGVANSTGAASGSLAAQNFGRGVAQGDASMQLAAQQAALSGMNTQAGIASSLSGTGNSLLSNAFANFGNTNQLISGLNSAQLNNSISALQGAGALNTLGLNNYMAALQTGSAQANAKNLSLFPYAGVATSLAGTPTPTGMFAGGLSQIGASGMGAKGWGGVLSGLGNTLSNWFGGGGSAGAAASDFSNLGDMSNTGGGIWSDSSILGDGSSFSGAGGQAATPAASSAASGLGNYAGGVGDAYGIYSGVKSGTPQGYAKAGMDAYKLYNTASGLFGAGAGLGAYGSGAAADAAVTSALGSVGAQTAGTSAAIAASNAAAIGGGAAGGAGAAGAGAGAGGGAALGAAGSVAAGLGAVALPIALGLMLPQVNMGPNYYPGLMSAVQNNAPGSAAYQNALTEMQADPNLPPQYRAQLNALGLQTFGQMNITASGSGGDLSSNLIQKF